jgi:hypothetical protein
MRFPTPCEFVPKKSLYYATAYLRAMRTLRPDVERNLKAGKSIFDFFEAKKWSQNQAK